MGVLLQNDQPVGGISADVIETINFSDLTTTSKTLPGAINELAANPSTTESMSQAEYNALTEAEKIDGTARFVYDAISTDESELWGRVGRNTLHTDAQIISNAINEIKDTMGSGTLTTTTPTIIGGINELNSSLTDSFKIINTSPVNVTTNQNGYASITPPTTPTGYTLIATALHYWSNMTTPSAISIDAPGTYVLSSANNSIQGLRVRYIYVKTSQVSS